MNCKPDQRAVCTRTLGVAAYEPFLGMVFTVRTIKEVDPKYGPIWWVDHDNRCPVDNPRLRFRKGLVVEAIADALLTPLPDDPGPDVEEDNEITNPASVEA